MLPCSRFFASVLIFFSAHYGGFSLYTADTSRGLFDSPHCFLTLHEIATKNSTSGELSGRELELNWFNLETVQEGDWIGLFNYDPSLNDSIDHQDSALDHLSVSAISGYHKTLFRLQPENFTSVGETCLHFWVAVFQNSNNYQPVLFNCLRLYPRWMKDRADVIGNVPLTSLMLPGTHDAGAWKVYDGVNDNVVTKYTFTQEENIYNQLASGIRYIDVRAAYYPREDEHVFWINHGDVRIREMYKLLDDVKRFVQETQEVVIMDFHGFPVGFGNETVHAMLYEFVTTKLGEYLAPRGMPNQETLNSLWGAGKYILWTYNDGFYSQRELLWPPLRHAWGDQNTVEGLHAYLPSAIDANACKGYFWSAMAEITPSAEDIILKPNYGLRRFAYDVNKPLNHWYHDEKWYSRSNIVSTDFYMGNNIVEACVTVNENRGVVC